MTEAGLAWARTVTSGDSSITLLMATESTGGICRWSARFSISSSFRSLSVAHLVPAGVLGTLDPALPSGHVLDGAARLLDHWHIPLSPPANQFRAQSSFVKDYL